MRALLLNPKHGDTEVIPGSPLFGAACLRVIEGTEWEKQVHYNLGGAGKEADPRLKRLLGCFELGAHG